MKRQCYLPQSVSNFNNTQGPQRRFVSGLPVALLGCVLLSISHSAGALGLDCAVSATGVAFGVYDPSNFSPTMASGNVHVFCTTLVSAAAQTNISLSTGSSGSYGVRAMSSGVNQLGYNLYQDPGYTTVWGDGSAGTSVVTDNALIAVLGTSIDHAVYGRITAGQYVAAGNYSDTIIVTVEFHEAL